MTSKRHLVFQSNYPFISIDLISFNLYKLHDKNYDYFYFTNEETNLESITHYDTDSELYFEQIGIKIPATLKTNKISL